MPLTIVDLCNMALAHLRQRPVTGDEIGILGDTPEASNCRRFYELAMRECFRAFDWQFARRYIAPPLIAGAGLPNWRYAYQYPTDIEAVRYIARNDRTEAPVRFRVMRTPDGALGQLAVYTNEQAAYIACTAYIADPAQYPSDFVEFAALTLAAHLAMPITGKAELMMGMRKIAEEAGKRAAQASSSSETDDAGESLAREIPPAAVTQVDIANAALSMLGQPAIVAFGDRTREGDTVRRFYRQAVDQALRAVDWPFARVVLVGANPLPSNVPNWKLRYDMPDCAAFRYVIRSAGGEQPVRYQFLRLGGIDSPVFVYTNEPDARFVVTAFVEDPTQWPQDFVQLATATLAQLMALSLTGKADVFKAMSEAVEAAGKMALVNVKNTETEQVGEDDTRVPLPVNDAPLDIANLALGLLAEVPIESFGERTLRASAVRQYYALALRATLRSVDWPFARAYTQAQPSNAPLIPGHFYAYAYPANCTAFRGFAKDYPTNYDTRFRLGNGAIYTRRPAGVLIYTRWDIDPAQYDPEFTTLLAHELAAMIAVRITGKAEAVVALRNTAKMLRDKARADAANEEMDELDERVPDWLAVRGIPSLVRQDREELMAGRYGYGRQIGPWGALPGSPQVNPTPPMITGPGPGSAILPAYIPGLTAPVPEVPQLLANSNFWVESVGGRIEWDGSLVVDDPSQHYVEAAYDVQEDN